MAKNGVVGDLLPELKRKANLDDETIQTIRLYVLHGHKIQKEISLEYSVASVPDYYQLYAERIPEDERTLEEDDRPMYAYHFEREPNKPHGVPFVFYVKPVSVPVTAIEIEELTRNRESFSRKRENDFRSVLASRGSNLRRSSLLLFREVYIQNLDISTMVSIRILLHLLRP